MKIRKIKKSALRGLIPYPAQNANKYTRGRLMVIGGSNRYPGAVCLASHAGLKCGSGYVEVACDSKTVDVVHAYCPDLVAYDWSGFSCNAAKLDEADAAHPKACLIGSGFELESDVQTRLLEDVLANAKCPVVVDGGALSALATEHGLNMASTRRELGYPLILTPHYGEAARLAKPLGIEAPECSYDQIDQDARFALELASRYGATVVLKGQFTLIASIDGSKSSDNSTSHEDLESFECRKDARCYLMDKGPACLAKAGTGDVLAGMTASFLSQGLSPLNAAKLSTSLHAFSATLAQKRLTGVCVCASDIIDFIPGAIKSLSER